MRSVLAVLLSLLLTPSLGAEESPPSNAAAPAESSPTAQSTEVAAPVAETAEAHAAIAEAFQFFGQEALVVTASRRRQSVREAPANIRVITRAQIRASGARSLSDILQYLPGYQVVKHKSGGDQLWVRGTTSAYNDKTLLLIDGHPFKELTYGQHPINEQVSLTDVERIELIKGPGSSLYGGNAFTGVINIITLDPLGDSMGEATGAGGDFNTYGASYVSRNRKGDVGIVGSGTYFGSDGDDHYFDENGAASQRRDSQRLLNANARVAWKGFTAGARFYDYVRNYFSRSDARSETLPTRTSLLSLDWDHEFGDILSVSVSSYYNYFDWRRDQLRYQNVVTKKLDRILSSDEKTQDYGFSVQGQWQLPFDNLLMTALDYEVESAYSLQRWQTRPSLTDPNPAPNLIRFATPANPWTQRWSAAVEDTYTATDWLRMTGGYRYDVDMRFQEQHNFRAAVVLQPVEMASMKLLWGTAFRAPSFRELNVVENPPSGVDDGNLKLQPERIETAESVLDLAPLSFMQLQVSAYRNVIFSSIAPSSATGKYENLGNYTTYGVEPGATLRAPFGTELYGNYTHQKSYDDKGNALGNVTEEMFNLGLSSALIPYLTARIDWHHSGLRNLPVGYQSGVPVTLRKYQLSSYDRSDLVFTTRDLPLEIQLGLYNAFDATYFDPDFGEGKWDMQWAGRTIFGTVRFTL